MSDILDKTRRALVAYITAGNVGTTNIYDGKNSAEKAIPMVGCGAENAKEDPTGTGNFWVDAEVTVRTTAMVDSDGVDPKIASDATVAAVIALFEIDNDSLTATLSSQIASYTVMGFDADKSQEYSVDGDVWIATWKRRFYCGGF